MERDSKKIICTRMQMHDFRVFKESKISVAPKINILADAVYRGMQRIHQNTKLPYRRTKKYPLTKEHRKENQELASKIMLLNM